MMVITDVISKSLAVEFKTNVITYLDLMDRLSQACHHHKDHIEMPLLPLIEDYHL